ncbi:MAG TPA: GNAT family N-acetyltransferase [Chloroflexia bacterium]|nr:GNAT family N-acetyltransferase [Chloroflexia bacterium]
MEKQSFRALTPVFDELRGERVIVRPYRVEDAEALQEAMAESREHLRPWMPFADDHKSVDEARDWITHQIADWLVRKNLVLGVWEAATGRYLGGTGLHPRDWEIGYFEIGYWLRKSAEGHGYMAEAVGLLVEFAFGPLGANRLEIQCDERNERSAAVARRLGFVQEALLRNDSKGMDGTLRNTLVFSLIPSDPR